MAVQSPSARDFVTRLAGRKVQRLDRRGKYLVFSLDDGSALVAHLRMTGNLLYTAEGCERNGALSGARIRVVFRFGENGELCFVDRRRLGRVWAVRDPEEVVEGLGPEPLAPEFTAGRLAGILSGRHAPIKPLLIDQQVIAGIGNMYADEALFEARIHPLRRAGDLTREETGRLHRAIRRVLRGAISSHGASVDSYRRPDGRPGEAHRGFKVAHRLGAPCPACGTPIARVMVRHRGTYFCPRCQPSAPAPSL